MSLDSSAKLKNFKERKLVFGERLQLKGEAPVIFSSFKQFVRKINFLNSYLIKVIFKIVFLIPPFSPKKIEKLKLLISLTLENQPI